MASSSNTRSSTNIFHTNKVKKKVYPFNFQNRTVKFTLEDVGEQGQYTKRKNSFKT